MANRSFPIWAMMHGETAGSAAGGGNGTTFLWLFFMTTHIPLVPVKEKAVLR
jgi:hypothetical protein